MCVPALAALGVVASLAQGVVGYMGAQQQADRQNAYYKQNALEAQAATRAEY